MEMEETSGYPAKINRPAYRNVLFRERLFSLLEEGNEPLVWVSGPAGCGKTTFLSSYIDHRKTPCIWYQFDGSDSDPGTFFHFLELARRQKTGKNTSLPRFSPSHSRDIKAFSRRYFEKYFQDLPPGLLNVFDSFPEDPPGFAMDVLLPGLSRLPPGIRVVILSRSEAPPATAILKLKGRLKRIGAEDMRLDAEEFGRAVGLHWVKGIPGDVIEILHGTLEGWYAGLMLMGEVFRTHQFAPEKFKTDKVDFLNITDIERLRIHELFAGEIWDGTDARVKDFLLRTSFLPQMTVSSAKALSGFERAGETLEYLCRRNLFTARSRQSPRVYQYHSLFREFLREKATEAFSKDQALTLMTRASRILRNNGQLETAASLMVETHAWKDLSQLILEAAPKMLPQGRHQLLSSWIEAIPENEREGDEKVSFAHGLCLLPIDPGRSRALFTRAMDIAAENGDAETAFNSWTRAVESVVYESSNYQVVVPLLDRKKALEKVFGGYPSRAVEAEVATGTLTALILGGINYPDLGYWTEKAVTLQKETGKTERYVQACLLAVLKHHYMGETLEMGNAAQALTASFSSLEPDTPLETVVRYASALAAWAAGDPGRSLEHVEKGLKGVEAGGVNTWEMQLLGQGVLSAFDCLDDELAGRYLSRMKGNLGGTSRNDQALFHYTNAFAESRAGEWDLAQVHAEKALELKKDVGNPIYIARAALALAEICCALGKIRKAESHLASSRAIAGKTGSALLSLLCGLVEAGIALSSGDREKAALLLDSALETGAASDIPLFWWFNRNVLVDLLALALERKSHTRYVHRLILAHRLTNLKQMPELEAWPWPVKIYSLGRFEILVKGEKVRFGHKAQEKPLALLKAILAFGGRDVPGEKLQEALWPDSDGSQAHQALATTLHRLRNILQVEDAIVHHQGKIALNPQRCWVDIWAVERALGQIAHHYDRNHREAGSCKGISLQAEKSLSLYTGHFLGKGDHDPWTIAPRERLRSKFVRSVKGYCSHLETEGKYEQALHWYRKTVELENLAEELHQGLIRCCLKLGRKSDALVAYQRCREALAAVLGLEPSEETKKLAGKITDGGTRRRGDAEIV